MSRILRSALVAGIALLGAHSLAQAEELKVIDTVRVSYSDLDLTNFGDARTMLARLQQAAYEACGGNERHNSKYDLMPFAVRDAYRRCRSDALARAVADVNVPALWQAYESSQSATRRLAQSR